MCCELCFAWLLSSTGKAALVIAVVAVLFSFDRWLCLVLLFGWPEVTERDSGKLCLRSELEIC